MKTELSKGWLFSRDGEHYEEVTVPHDAMIGEERKADCPSGGAGAYFPGGKYFYEKKLQVPDGWREKTIYLEFEGIYRKAEVRVNGEKAAYCAYGYTGFWVQIDPFLKCGEENVIQVIADNTEVPNSRWYTGGGIYRPVWLWEKEKSHILPEGVKITTLSLNPAAVQVDTAHTQGEVRVEVLEQGKVVAEGTGDIAELEIPDATLWNDEDPHLYECRVTLTKDGQQTDQITEKFGLRKVKWGSEGLFINGKETLLRGGCVHHDHGILGARCFRKSEFRRIKILKEAGYNAIRSAHNPASKALLEACDYYGLYVMDETWDMWYNRKNKYDYACDFMEHYKEDIRAMVSRDYNHPSVIMYSIGNEVAEPGEEKGLALEKEMIEIIHGLDKTRAVTCGMNLMIIKMAAEGKGIYKEEGGRDEKQKPLPNSSKLFNMITSQVGAGMNKAGNSKEADRLTTPGLDALDIAGYNYASGRYPLEGEAHPKRVVMGSETFPQDIYKNWEMVKKYPYLIGDFMWTAWDYLGEAGGGAWGYTDDANSFEKPYPWLLAEMGVYDILGNENAQAGYASVVWGIRKTPYLAVQPVNHPGKEPMKSVWRGTNALPSWSWKGCGGNKAIVEVYADAARVDLYLDGEKIGSKKCKEMQAVFKVKYRPGTLEAVAYDVAGKEMGRTQLTSAASEIQIGIHPEEDTVKAGQIVYIPITIEDINGIVESNADTELSLKVTGGTLLGFGSANPRTEESYVSGIYRTYYGRAMAVVLSGEADAIRIEVAGKGLEKGEAEIKIV